MTLNSPSRWLLGAMAALAVTAAPAQTGPLTSLREHLLVDVSGRRTTLDRMSGELISTAEVRLYNLGGKTLLSPLHAAVHLSTGVVSVAGAAGGPGDPLYGTYYVDLSSQLTAGEFIPGRWVSFPLEIRYPRDRAVRLDIEPFGLVQPDLAPVLNLDPLAYTIPEGGRLVLPMTATDADSPVVVLSASPKRADAVFSATNGNPAAATFVFDPPEGVRGRFVFTFTARDPGGLADIRNVEVEVAPANRAPAVSVPSAVELDEGDIVSIPVTASDPDGDLVTVTASPLPDNAVYIQASGAIRFGPDTTQQGQYEIVCTAFDGDLYSPDAVVTVTVHDVQAGTDTNKFTLTVYPAESPTLVARQKITGAVNADTNLPPPPAIASALITGVAPVNAPQGSTLDVTLTGKSSGNYVTHFAPDVSAADFGAGITVNRLTINSPTEAVANITVAAGASVGIRGIAVRTDTETAVAVPAFFVEAGAVSVSGVLRDRDSGLPVAGARITVVGWTGFAVSGPDGSFTLSGLPPGEHELVINPPNHAVVRVPVALAAGIPVDLGDLVTAPTVFDPSAPAGPSLFSVINRGLGSVRPGILTLDDAMALVRDTLLLVGGHEAGLYDAFGNQLNPEVDGDGLISLAHDGVELYGAKLAVGDSVTLVKLLADLSFAFNYRAGGPPPSLAEWMAALQDAVNAAWANPTDPFSAVPIAVFNSGRTLSPDPPTLVPDMRLTRMQAYLVVSGILGAMVNRQGDWYARLQEIPERDWATGRTFTDALGAFFGPCAYAQVGGGSTGIFTKTWDSVMSDLGTYPTSAYYSAAGGTNVYTQPAVEDILSAYYRTGDTGTLAEVKSVLESNFTGVAKTQLDEIFNRNPFGVSQAIDQLVEISKNDLQTRAELDSLAGGSSPSFLWRTVSIARGPAMTYPLFGLNPVPSELQPQIIVKSLAPDAPFIYYARENNESIGTYKIPVVDISFYPSGDDRWPKANPGGRTFYYRLWRLEISTASPTNPAVFRMVAGGTVTSASTVDYRRPRKDPDHPNRLRFTVPLPPPGMNHYRIDCIRSDPSIVDNLTTNQLAELDAWLHGFIDEPLAVSREQAGALGVRNLLPGATILKNKDVEISAMSNVGSVNVAGGGSGLSALGRIDLEAAYDATTNVYVGIPGYRATTNPADRGSGGVFTWNPATGSLTNLFTPGFMQPGQVGLAKEEDANTFFLENAASEGAYGGRIFRYDLNGAAGRLTNRVFVGSVNYYSFLTQRSSPVLLQDTVMGKPVNTNFGDALILADQTDFKLKYHQVHYPEYIPAVSNVDVAGHNVSRPWAWVTTNYAGPDNGRLFFQANTDLAFDREKETLYITQGPYVLSTTGGADAAESITTNETLFASAAGCAVCESRDGSFLFVADAGADRILRVPLSNLPIHVSSDAAEKQALIQSMTVITNVNNPGDLAIIESGRAIVWADQDGLQYSRFGLYGQLTNAFGEPLSGAEVILAVGGNETATATDTNGVYYFAGEGATVKGTLRVNHPAYPLPMDVNVDYQCGYGFETNAPAALTPCITISSPPDGMQQVGTVTSVRGLITPEDVDFSLANGSLEVNNGYGNRRYALVIAADNTFLVTNVSLTAGSNYLKARVEPFGDYRSAEAPTVRIAVTPSPPSAQWVSGIARDGNGDLAPGGTVLIYVDGVLWGEAIADGCAAFSAKQLPLGAVTWEVQP